MTLGHTVTFAPKFTSGQCGHVHCPSTVHSTLSGHTVRELDYVYAGRVVIMDGESGRGAPEWGAGKARGGARKAGEAHNNRITALDMRGMSGTG